MLSRPQLSRPLPQLLQTQRAASDASLDSDVPPKVRHDDAAATPHTKNELRPQRVGPRVSSPQSVSQLTSVKPKSRQATERLAQYARAHLSAHK